MKGETGKRKEKKEAPGHSQQENLNSSTAAKYDPASQILEKGKLQYQWNVDIFHIIKTYYWESID